MSGEKRFLFFNRTGSFSNWHVFASNTCLSQFYTTISRYESSSHPVPPVLSIVACLSFSRALPAFRYMMQLGNTTPNSS